MGSLCNCLKKTSKVQVSNQNDDPKQPPYVSQNTNTTVNQSHVGSDSARVRPAQQPGIVPIQKVATPGALKKLSIEKIFSYYAGNKSNGKIEGIGLENFFTDLGYSTENVQSTMVSFIFQVKDFAEITHPEFTDTCERLQAINFDQLKAKLAQEVTSIQQSIKLMKSFFIYVFRIGTESKAMPSNLASQTLNVLLGPGSVYENNALAKEFIQHVADSGKVINFDTFTSWAEFFMRQNMSNLAEYDFTGSWPTYIDDFVEKCVNKNVKN